MNKQNSTLSPALAEASELGRFCLSNDMAISKYCLGNLYVYQAGDGRYYMHELPTEDYAFFFIGQLAPLQELEPLEEEYLQQVSVLSNHDHFAQKLSPQLHLVAIEHSDTMTHYFLYHESLQTFLLVDQTSYDLLCTATIAALQKLELPRNHFGAAYKMVLAEDGDIVRVEVA